MKRRAWRFAFLASAALAGCGFDGRGFEEHGRPRPSQSAPPAQTETPAPTPAPPSPTLASGEARWAGDPLKLENYRTAKSVCGAFTRQEIARDLGITSTDAVDLAEKWAEGYRSDQRQPVFEGCLHGILARRD